MEEAHQLTFRASNLQPQTSCVASLLDLYHGNPRKSSLLMVHSHGRPIVLFSTSGRQQKPFQY